jgi:hypothetical protein
MVVGGSDDTFLGLEYSEQSSVDLRGRQSVRTTFKLSARAIDALSILAGQLGIKQKSLVDHLIEDTRALQLIAADYDDLDGRRQRVAKTYVISRRTLENLERVASEYNTPRDILVEHSIERILPLLHREKQKHARRKELLVDLQGYLDAGAALLVEAEHGLGGDDPALQELLAMVQAVSNCRENIEGLVNRGKKIEEF